MKFDFGQKYQVDGDGYPVDLPRLELFVFPPYYMPFLEQNGIAVRSLQEDALDLPLRWSLEYWLLLNSHFAAFHNSPLGDEDKIISLAVKECELLFRAFLSNVSRVDDYSFDMANTQAKLWVESTKKTAWSAFRNNRLSSDSLKICRGTSRLLKSLLSTLDGLYESFSESAPDSPYLAVKPCIFYNMWGDDLQEMCHGLVGKSILTSSEKAKVDVEENKRAFFTEVEMRIREATEERSELEFDTKSKSLCQLLETVFVDYLRHIRKARIPNDGIKAFLCNHWRYVTIAIIQRAFTSLTADYAVELTKERLACLSPCVDGEEMYAHDKRKRIVMMATETVNSLCAEFLSIKETQPWADELIKLEIHYSDLYLALKDKYFSGVSLDSFEYAIREADFREIYAAAKRKGARSGMVGSIYFFVSELGDNLGEEWLKQAAESVTDEKGSAAVARIRSHSKTASQKELKYILKQFITHYRPRKIRDRQA